MTAATAAKRAETTRIELLNPTTRETVGVELRGVDECVVGSGGDAALIVAGPQIQVRHARIVFDGHSVLISPYDGARVSVNGHAISAPAAIAHGDWLALGVTVFQVRCRYAATAPRDDRSLVAGSDDRVAAAAGAATLTIGRASECDVCIDSPIVSRRHARLQRVGAASHIEDLGSTNGTFVNGQRLESPRELQNGDQVGIATFSYIFDGAALHPVGQHGQVMLEVRGLAKRVVDRASRAAKALLEDIDLVIFPGEFAVIFGTSGSGKSTLLDAMNGRRPGSSGQVLINGADLYANFERFRAAIGYVPQQDIVHRKITIRKALRYTAELRLPADTSQEEIQDYITRVLERVGLEQKIDSPIDTPAPLSGGQLKRVSLAVELVAKPNALFLDEVTSGLDAGTDRRMMQLFRDLASDGKTVVCVTHTLENIDVCNIVVLLHEGRMVYVGPPDGALKHFGIGKLADVYDLLGTRPAAEWAQLFQRSAYYRQYVEQRLAGTSSSRTVDAGSAIEQETRRSHWFNWRQAKILARRYVDLLFADRRNLAILLFQAPLIGAVIASVFKLNDTDALATRAATETQLGFMLVIAAIWFGCLNSAREIVKELPIYLRERTVNLELAPYVASKLILLGILCTLQCVFLLAVVSLGAGLHGAIGSRLAVLILSAFASTAMGLAISAFVNTNDKAIATVPILLIPQVVLSNNAPVLSGTMLGVAKATVISFWAFDAMKSTLGDELLGATGPTGAKLIEVSAGLGRSAGMLGMFFLAFLLFALIGLRLKDRQV